MKIMIILSFVLMLLVSSCSTQDCGTDLTCFKELARDCSKAKVNIKYGDNDVRLTSRGNLFGECKISLKIEQVGEKLNQKDPALASLAKGKTLNCAIPIEIVDYNLDQYIDEIINLEQKFDQYCSGLIKDVLKGSIKETISKKIPS